MLFSILKVQGQLAITGKPYCDFVVWTKVDTHVQRILPLPEFWKEKEAALEEAFYSHMLPVLQASMFLFTRPLLKIFVFG